jgi:cytochrome P450
MTAKENLSVSGPKGQFFFGCVNDFRRDPLEFTRRCAKQYGDFVPIPLYNRTAYLISHPELIEEVLVTQSRHFIKPEPLRSPGLQRIFGEGLVSSDGEFWARQRRLIQPAFHQEKISRYADIMVEETRKLLTHWRAGKRIDVQGEMSALTLRIVVRTLFGSEISQEEQNAVAGSIASLLGLYADQLSLVGILSLFMVTEMRWRLLRAANQLDDIIYRIIRERTNNLEDGDDLFSMLQKAKDERGISMTTGQLRDEIMTLFLAGHETTASALSWTWLLLSQNSEIERKLCCEVENVLGSRAATIDDISALKFTENVIKESMRLFPPIWSIGRQSLELVYLKGYKIPAGANVIISQWVVHRDHRFFDDPLEFRPERWSDSQIGTLPKFAFFPFGGGPRICIGNAFAMTEAILILSTVIQQHRLKLDQPEPAPLATLTLRPQGTLHMRIEGIRQSSFRNGSRAVSASGRGHRSLQK